MSKQHKGYEGHRNYNAWNVALYLFTYTFTNVRLALQNWEG